MRKAELGIVRITSAHWGHGLDQESRVHEESTATEVCKEDYAYLHRTKLLGSFREKRNLGIVSHDQSWPEVKDILEYHNDYF